MNDFPFCRTRRCQRYCEEIVYCLVHFCHRTEEEAVSILNDLWGKYSDLDTQSPLLYHEVPFYYAMMLGHDRVLGHPDELWYQKAKCWPPPEEADARHLAFEEELMEEESDE